MASTTVERLNKMVYWELREAGEEDPAKIEALIRKYQYVLHPQHFHMVGMKHTLSQVSEGKGGKKVRGGKVVGIFFFCCCFLYRSRGETREGKREGRVVGRVEGEELEEEE